MDASEAEILVDEHDLHLAHAHGPPQHHQTLADAVRGIAVVAAVGLDRAGRPAPEPLGIFGSRNIARPPDCRGGGGAPGGAA